ncbi:MAG: hypothetical protein HC897_18560 [Thermoanaerobaculia bacterium]|nr:hypothetical protein [Thermoanaerobaculia bacterium]
MSFAEGVGAFGVSLLLLAFFLNLAGYLSAATRRYRLLNAVGAGLACYASYLIGFWPFVVLEGTWCAFAIVALARGNRAAPSKV